MRTTGVRVFARRAWSFAETQLSQAPQIRLAVDGTQRAALSAGPCVWSDLPAGWWKVRQYTGGKGLAMKSKSSRIGLDGLVERQLRNWEIRKAQIPETPQSALSRVHPYVAISRMTGSGGAQIADRVHEHLGWPLVDKQILDYMAKDDRTRRTLYELMDERDLGMVNEMLLPVITGMPARQQDYFRRLTQSALSIAQTESAIFLGRGIGYILPPEVGLHIRVVAAPETCISNYARRNKLDAAQAQVEWERIERERVHFLNLHFGENALQLNRFNLVVTMDRFTIEEATDLILHLVESKIFPDQLHPSALSE
jgi:cytidylate kinase